MEYKGSGCETRTVPATVTGDCEASTKMVTDLCAGWEGREAARLSRESGNLACFDGNDHIRSGKEEVASSAECGKARLDQTSSPP